MPTALLDHPLAARGQAYTQMLEIMKRRGPTALHSAERDQILDTADALLFDEPQAQEKLVEAGELIARLVESDRWSEESAQQLGAALQAIAAR